MTVAFSPQPKGESRLEDRTARDRQLRTDDAKFKIAVWMRDDARCRCCGRKVVRAVERVQGRGEIHHIHGKIGRLRFEVRSALLLCVGCHEKVTGRVNDRLMLTGRRHWTVPHGIFGTPFIDATYPVTFRSIA